MRKYLLILFCLIAVSATAQNGNNFYLKPISLAVGHPLGAFAKKGIGPDIPGKVKMGIGVEGYAQWLVVKGFMAGLGYRILDYGHDASVTDRHLQQEYTLPGFYTEVKSTQKAFSVSSIYLQIAKQLKLHECMIEPFFQAGLGFYAGDNSAKIHQKKANENYWKDTRISDMSSTSTAQTFFYPRVGVNAAKCIYKVFYLVGGVSYGWGKVNSKMRVMTSDFEEKGTEINTIYQHKIAEMSAMLGVEFRFHKKRP